MSVPPLRIGAGDGADDRVGGGVFSLTVVALSVSELGSPPRDVRERDREGLLEEFWPSVSVDLNLDAMALRNS